ncbi:hypothetical protein SAMN05660776_1627 [Salegentibacter holothuriorum]|uniref:Outer membrane protein beta-barrel domain-containing protein n=1 Tax=Salegentibacter holothuriorum TaxID=241145 RepID=A0A1T5BZ34_9FLAO|nr:hypothetical protein [Salegentibacter holothuriorum]SKB52401.1 hypothetical protein SAMN05660776_1627 [Salegentibacter holothuriorum]
MKERKNIDRLYQEKFRDFAPEPNPELWNKIAGKLKEKDEKKPFILPLWMKLGGVAAVLALVLGGYYFSQNNFTGTNVVFEVEESAKPQINFPEINKNEKFTNALEVLKNNIKETIYSTAEDSKNSSSNNNSALATQNTNREAEKSEISSLAKENTSHTITDNLKQKDAAIAEENIQGSEKGHIQHQDFINPDSKNEEQLSNGIALKETESNNKENKLSTKDSLQVAKELAQIEAEKKLDKEGDMLAKTAKKKLRLSTFAAPVFYDNIGKGSSIDPEFAGNNTNSEVSMAYGMNLAYAISDKIKIRSGISKVAMSYNIEDIVFSPGVAASSINTINYDKKNNNPQLNSVQSGSSNSPNSESQFDLAPLSRSIPGELNQQFGFIEVPLEIEYSLIDRKIGLNIIAGGSSLFLDENSIQVNANNQNTRLGEANNINKVSFSTNIGVGLDYKLTDSFKLNVEPIFKYQLDTFDNTPGVRPFYFGVYSGVSFSF